MSHYDGNNIDKNMSRRPAHDPCKPEQQCDTLASRNVFSFPIARETRRCMHIHPPPHMPGEINAELSAKIGER